MIAKRRWFIRNGVVGLGCVSSVMVLVLISRGDLDESDCTADRPQHQTDPDYC